MFDVWRMERRGWAQQSRTSKQPQRWGNVKCGRKNLYLRGNMNLSMPGGAPTILSKLWMPGAQARQLGDSAEELRAVERAVRWGDCRRSTMERFAKLLMAWGRLEEAKAVRLKQLRRERTWKKGMLGLAAIHWEARSYEAALSTFEQVVEVFPDDFHVLIERAKHTGLAGHSVEAERMFEDLARRFPQNTTEWLVAKVQVLHFEQRRAEAMALLEESVARTGGSERTADILHSMRIRNLLLQYRHEPSKRLSEALGGALADCKDLTLYEESLVSLGELSRFQKSIENGLKANESAVNLVHLAYKFHLARKTEDARKVWSRYIERTPMPQLFPVSAGSLRRLDHHALPEQADEVRLYTVIRNERWRLAWFCDYYRKIGVNRFFFVDNDSSDGSREWLLEQPDVHVFHTTESYASAYSGMRWVNHLVRRFGQIGWTMYVDVDEAFVFPNIEAIGLKGLIQQMDENNDDVIQSFMVDMFAEESHDLTPEGFELDFIRHYPLFENNFDFTPSAFCPYVHTSGGVRRVFGHHENLTKTPLIRGGRDIQFLLSSHRVTPGQVCETTGANLHFKLAGDCLTAFQQDLNNNQRIAYCRQRHQTYLDRWEDGVFNLRSSRTERYESSQTLVDAGLLQVAMAEAKKSCDFVRLGDAVDRRLLKLELHCGPEDWRAANLNPLLAAIQFGNDRRTNHERMARLLDVVSRKFPTALSGQLAICRLKFALGDHEGFVAGVEALAGRDQVGFLHPFLKQTAERLSGAKPASLLDEKVFVIGLSRTGTTTMNATLKSLGYCAVHWRNPLSLSILGKEDWGLYDAFSDISVAAQFELLYEQYPNAKFIYTCRPEESWVASVQRHYNRGLGVSHPYELREKHRSSRFAGVAGEVEKELYCAHKTWAEARRAHDDRVQRFFQDKPKSKFLRFSVFEGHGWNELCRFLDKPLPSRPFPHANRARTNEP